MSPLISTVLSSTILFVIVLAAHLLVSRVMGQPREWMRSFFFALGFAAANFVNEFFGITGLTKYVVLIAVALPVFYIGQYLQSRFNKPAA